MVSVVLMCINNRVNNNSSNYNGNNSMVSNNNNRMMDSNLYLNSHRLNKCDIK